MNIVIKNSTLSEMPQLCKLAEIDGRNPGLNDSDLFFQFDPEGFFIAVNQNEIVGSVSAVSFGNDFGFIGLHFVLPQVQNTIVGDKLLEVALDKLGDRNIGINCSASQVEYYSNHGFTPCHEIYTYEGIADGLMPALDDIVSPFKYSFDSLDGFDKQFFPYDRKKLLMLWCNQPQSLLLGKYKDNKYCAYGVYAPSANGFKISSLVANTPQNAEHLLSSLLGHLEKDSHYFIDLPKGNEDAIQLAEKMKMKKVNETIRMYSKSDPNLSLQNIYSFTNNELG